MKKHFIKSHMFFAILCMSIIIFALAFSAGGMGKWTKEKDIPFLSDHYFICSTQESLVSPAEFIEKTGCEEASQIIFADKFRMYPAAWLTEEFFSALGLAKQDYGKQDVAFVNEQYKPQCYQDADKWMINVAGNAREVAGFFKPENAVEQVVCYLNAQAENLQENIRYTYILVDVPQQAQDVLKEDILKNYPDMQLSDWNGEKQGDIYSREMYWYAALLCGLVLCINCTSFAQMWVRSYERELAIRRIVGADVFKNHCFLAKEYGKLFAGAMAAGWISLCVIFGIIVQCEKLIFVREIFGEKPDIKVFLLSCGMVLLITGIVLELIFARLRKEKIMAG